MMAGVQSAAAARGSAQHSELDSAHPDQKETTTYAKPC